jgi:hypothetical protein
MPCAYAVHAARRPSSALIVHAHLPQPKTVQHALGHTKVAAVPDQALATAAATWPTGKLATAADPDLDYLMSATPCMPCLAAPSDDVALDRVTAGRAGIGV